MSFSDQFENLFGDGSVVTGTGGVGPAAKDTRSNRDQRIISSAAMLQLLKRSWSGDVPFAMRAMCWRVLLGLISSSDKSLWVPQMKAMVQEYKEIKSKVMPSLDKVEVDPLSSLSNGNSQSAEWSIYYKNVDLTNFITCDLDRLYITGIADEYFELKERRDMLLAILLIWSYQHPIISYRQGMHEVAGYILYCVEKETAEWKVNLSSAEDQYGLLSVTDGKSVEAHTFHLFVRIMNELEPLYDPISVTPSGIENQPFVVQFSTKIQEHYLRMLDSELCMHLEHCNISAQLYGLRWSRLLLGREFTAENEQVYKLWDFMFACCYEAENFSSDVLLDIDSPPNICSVLAAVRIAGSNQYSNYERRKYSSLGTIKHVADNESSAPSVPPYVCTPLLGALGDLMLALLLNIRDQLLDSDSSGVLALVMRYPQQQSVTPVLDYADMIKRGVILGPPKRPPQTKRGKQRDIGGPLRINNNYNTSSGGTHHNYAGSSWLNSSTLQKVTEKFNQVTAAVGNGISEIVHKMVDDGDDSAPYTHGKPDTNSVHRTTKDIINESNVHIIVKDSRDHTIQPNNNNNNSNAPHTEDETASTAAATICGDPLSGLLDQDNVRVKNHELAPSSPILTGKGTNYKNVPADMVIPVKVGDRLGHDDRDPLSGAATRDLHPSDSTLNSPSITGLHIRKKLMNSGWFPNSTTKKDSTRRENRDSSGVDLNILSAENLNESGAFTNNSVIMQNLDLDGTNSNSFRDKVSKSSNILHNNAVGDRLLDLADSLSSIVAPSGHELAMEMAVRKETVKRLRSIADVLSGLITIAEYDAKFLHSPSHNLRFPETPFINNTAQHSTTVETIHDSSAEAHAEEPRRSERSDSPLIYQQDGNELLAVMKPSLVDTASNDDSEEQSDGEYPDELLATK